MKRKILIVLLAIICAISCVVLVACNGGGGEQEALDLIVLEQTGTVQDPFTLPKKAGGFDNVVWTSSNPDALTVTEQQDTYLATPHLSDSAVDVTLTASLGSATKQFTLTVKGIDAWMFYDAFTFPQSNRNISSDFDLATSFSIDVTDTPATIAWEIKEGGDVAEIENGNHVKVTPIPGASVRVRIQAIFTYKTTTAQISYTFNVTEVLDHNALVDAWYNTPGQTIEISGYVVGRAQTYYSGSTYKNVSVYVVDEDGCHSFYFYAINFEEAQIAKLQPGTKVNVVGAAMSVASQAGNVIEGSGGTLTLDASETTPKTLQPYDAIDDDLMGEVPAVKYHTGGLVKVDNWTVKSVSEFPTSKSGTAVTLTKGGVDLKVGYSNYMEGFYYTQDSSKNVEFDSVATELLTKATGLQVGDVVTVTGVLSYHNGWQLMPRSADDIETGADDSYTGANGKAAKSAIDAVNKFVADNGLNALVAVDKTVTLPATSNGVTITYRVCRDAATIAIEGNTLTITPAEAAQEDAVIEAAYTIGNYKTYSYFTVKAWKVSDDDIVARVAGALNQYVPAEVTKNQTIQLPVGDAMSADLTIAWEATVDGAAVEWATIDAKGVLTITLPAEAATLHLKATVSLRAVTPIVKEYDISVSAAPTQVFKAIDAPAAGSEYFLAQLVNDEYYYATGSMVNTYYFGTSTDVADAATFEIVADGDNWLIKQGARFVELAASEDGSHINAFYREARTEGKYWTWDNTNKVFVWCDQFSNYSYTLGNYNNNTSIATQRVPLSSTGFAAKLGTMVPVSEVGGGDDPDTKSYGIQQAETVTAGEYYLGLYSTAKKDWYFFTGVMGGYSNFYYATSTEKDDAALVVLEAKDGGFNIKVKETNLYLNLGPRGSDYTKSSLSIDATAKTVWKWDAENNYFYTELTAPSTQTVSKFYLGNFGDYYDLSGLEKFDSSSYAGVVGQIVEVEDEGGDDPEPTPPTPVEAPDVVSELVTGNYKVVMYDSGDGKLWYAKGELDTKYNQYLQITTDESEAAVFTVTVEGGKISVQVNNQYLEAFASTGSNGKTYVIFRLVASPSTTDDVLTYTWNAENKTLYVDYDGTNYFFGVNYKSATDHSLFRDSIGSSSVTYLTNGRNFPIQFVSTDEQGGGGSQGGDDGGDVDVPERPTDTVAVSIKSTDLQILDNSQDSAYNKYKGDQTVGDFTINIAGIMVNTMTKPADVGVVQFKNNDGTLKITGKFTTLYIVGYCTKEYSEKTFIVTVDGTAVAAEKYVGATETGDYADFQNSCYKITLLVTLDMSEAKEVVVKSNGGGAFYATEVTFFGEGGGSQGGGGGDVDPDPTPVNHGTEEAPLSVEEFLALTDLPSADKEYSSFDVWVKGYIVTSVQGPSRGEYNLYISDVKGNAGTTVQVYWAASDQQPFIGDLIVVHGYIQKYGTKFELVKKNGNSSGTNVITISERAQDNVEVEITQNDNATISVDKQSGTNGQQVVITVTINQGYDFVKLTVDGVEITAKDSDGKYLAYIGDVTGDGKTTIELTVTLHVDKTYTLVENTDVLVEGAVVVFVYKYTSGDTTSIWLAGEMSGKFFTVVKDAATMSADGKSLSQVSTLAQEFTIGKSGEHYTFAVDGNLVGITSTSNNNLNTSDSKRTTTWDITIKDGIATILSTVIDSGNEAPTCKLQCNTNANANQERFSNYKTGTQKDFQLFLVEEAD